jgi:hypothetical protein
MSKSVKRVSRGDATCHITESELSVRIILLYNWPHSSLYLIYLPLNQTPAVDLAQQIVRFRAFYYLDDGSPSKSPFISISDTVLNLTGWDFKTDSSVLAHFTFLMIYVISDCKMGWFCTWSCSRNIETSCGSRPCMSLVRRIKTGIKAE